MQFDDGKVLSLDHAVMSKNPGTWKMDFFFPDCEDDLSEGVEPRQGDDVKIIGGALTGAEGEVMELTTTPQGNPAVVVYLRKDADMKVYGKAGDEVIVQPKFVEVDRGIQAGLS